MVSKICKVYVAEVKTKLDHPCSSLKAQAMKMSDMLSMMLSNWNNLYNVCSVHRGNIMDTSGGYHEYIGWIS